MAVWGRQKDVSMFNSLGRNSLKRFHSTPLKHSLSMRTLKCRRTEEPRCYHHPYSSYPIPASAWSTCGISVPAKDWSLHNSQIILPYLKVTSLSRVISEVNKALSTKLAGKCSPLTNCLIVAQHINPLRWFRVFHTSPPGRMTFLLLSKPLLELRRHGVISSVPHVLIKQDSVRKARGLITGTSLIVMLRLTVSSLVPSFAVSACNRCNTTVLLSDCKDVSRCLTPCLHNI